MARRHVNALEKAHGLALAVMSLSASSPVKLYASLSGLRCFALRLQKLQSTLVQRAATVDDIN